VSSKNVTLGVPRLREIINVAANIKTPSLSIYLKEEKSNDKDVAKNVINKIEFTTLRDVTESTEIYYDPNPEHTVVEEDREFMSFYFEIPDDDFMDSASPWMLRFLLDRRRKEDKELTNHEISERINVDWAGDLKAISSVMIMLRNWFCKFAFNKIRKKKLKVPMMSFFCARLRKICSTQWNCVVLKESRKYS